jgi:hypothetical protein
MKNFKFLVAIALVAISTFGVVNFAGYVVPTIRNNQNVNAYRPPAGMSRNDMILSTTAHDSKNINCPINTYSIPNTNLCRDTNNIYGAFGAEITSRCLNKSGGKACEEKIEVTLNNSKKSMVSKWNINFYNRIK